jgi:hypothetical protein
MSGLLGWVDFAPAHDPLGHLQLCGGLLAHDATAAVYAGRARCGSGFCPLKVGLEQRQPFIAPPRLTVRHI